MNSYKLDKYKGHVIEIWEDERRDPREDDNATHIFCFHKRMSIGDTHDHEHHEFDGWEGFKKHLIEEHNAAVIKPLYMYDHSGQTIATTPFSCRFDSGQIGWVFVDHETMRENDWDEKRCEEVIDADVKYYDRYVQGEPAYGFTITGPVNDDSVGGYDSKEDAENTARESIDATLLSLEQKSGGASAKYRENIEKVNAALAKLKDKIIYHGLLQESHPNDWGYVGDAAHWLEVIESITQTE